MMRFFKIFTETAEASASAGYRLKKTAASLLSCSLAMAVCTMLMLSSCSKDTPGEEIQYCMNIAVTIPDATEDALTTRHGDPVAGEGDENRISTLTFIVFKSDGTYELTKSIAINPDNTSSDPMWDSGSSKLRLLLSVGAKKVYAIANWSLTGTAEMPSLSGVQSISALEGILRTHTNVMPTNPPVMTGYLPVTLMGGESSVKVQLTRQIARVEVYPQISKGVSALGATVSVEGVQFVNMPQKAYLLPRTSSPSMAVWNQSSFVGTTSGTITSVVGGAAPTRYGRYYIPEFLGTEPMHTIMVIKAKFNGTDTYYFVDINGDTTAQPSQYAVERNHSYRYTVIIQGYGSSSPDPGTRNGFDMEQGRSNIITQLEIVEL